MKKQFIYILSFLCLSMGIISNANAGCHRRYYDQPIGYCYPGESLNAYIYNKVPGAVVTATSKGQTVRFLSGQWVLDKAQARYASNIKMHFLVLDIVDKHYAVGTSHTLHLDIRKNGQVGSCDITYDYDGSASQYDWWAELGAIHLKEMSCTDNYQVMARGVTAFPNSLILFSR